VLRSSGRAAGLAFVSVLSFAVLGCGKHGSREKPKTAPAPAGPEVQIPVSALTAPGDGGDLSVGATVPADFPKVVPIYEGARVVFASKSSSPQGKQAWTATLETADPRERVVEFYKSHMPAFRLVTSMDMGDTTMAVWQGDAYTATLMAATEEKETRVTVTVGGK
jgi:hypothetical protein